MNEYERRMCLCCLSFIFAETGLDFVLQHGRREEHMLSFLLWLSEHGVDTSAVAIEQFADTGYGLKALRDITVSTIIIIVIVCYAKAAQHTKKR